MSSVVVAIDSRHARVGRFASGGAPCVTDIAGKPASNYLLRVVRAVGDADVVGVVGSDPIRLAFEREFVSIVGHPERLRDLRARA
jgi:hypothetical protein